MQTDLSGRFYVQKLSVQQSDDQQDDGDQKKQIHHAIIKTAKRTGAYTCHISVSAGASAGGVSVTIDAGASGVASRYIAV